MGRLVIRLLIVIRVMNIVNVLKVWFMSNELLVYAKSCQCT
jgi:hypothetical protein